MNKRAARIRRAKKSRERIKRQARETGIARMAVHRTPKHIYAQIIGHEGGKVLAQASTLDPEFKKNTQPQDDKGAKVSAAQVVGKLIADRAMKAGVTKVAFDRSGFKFHGRVAALANAAREQGLVI